jgi:hypothetical protein
VVFLVALSQDYGAIINGEVGGLKTPAILVALVLLSAATTVVAGARATGLRLPGTHGRVASWIVGIFIFLVGIYALYFLWAFIFLASLG